MPDGSFSEILVVDLLGGIGDLVMVLPAVHALAASHPGARLRVVTHEPGAGLLRGDPAVTGVRVPADGGERDAVAAELAERRPDLAVTTTRYGGIPDLLRGSGARCVTDLWRRPPPDELVGDRYLRILAEEGVLEPSTVDPVPRLRLSTGERADGARALAALLGPTRRRPVVLVPEAGMAVKLWPRRRWKELVAILDGLGVPVATAPADRPLRELAALFADVARRGGVVVGGDTGPLRVAGASGARTVALFGPTLASRYGLGDPAATHLQGRPDCPYRRPTAITTQVCWWHADCPLSPTEPECMADIPAAGVAEAVLRSLTARP
ncbi:glycosyltransferase family 9 protein [Phytohabitans sp. ZYX-F-186]|uniref:Glycosyltransferase family 9 protein n=1 Tax=Phytohabitans maris TaxID=3071409 RepID=A0ABU0ZD34_9ACTN|nr:glycosyltransferase family 9 protein [Phytohabitans sp. ZYX-F-186]MDQ7904969.1 glycosyltransferase family 9 protein [Phytohabitans sp. ZYX-F-186]